MSRSKGLECERRRSGLLYAGCVYEHDGSEQMSQRYSRISDNISSESDLSSPVLHHGIHKPPYGNEGNGNSAGGGPNERVLLYR